MIANNFDYLGNFPSNIPVLIIAGDFGYNPILTGKNDGKVAVDETFLSTPHEHETVHAGHSWISYNSKAINLAKKFIMNQ